MQYVGSRQCHLKVTENMMSIHSVN